MDKHIGLILIILWNIIVRVNAAREPPTVTTEQGVLMGFYMTMFRTQRVVAYLGIPYAQPPIGERRFTPPIVDLLKWEGVRNATTLQKECWQNNQKARKQYDELFMKIFSNPEDNENRQFDEDCLYLNIYIPDGPPPPDGFAVIVWLHGGDFSAGSPYELDPFQLVFKQKVIVITVAFRLNIFGFFTTNDGESPGNFGLMDQSAALLWIKNNIKLFGGNDSLITLAGHGAGAISTNLHLTSGEWSEGLFNKAIIMSGSAMLDSAVRMPDSYTKSLDRTANAFGCFRKPIPKLLDCLRRVDANILSESAPDEDWRPVIDAGLSNTTTPFIPDYPRILAERGILRNVPVLIGFTDMEEALELSSGDMMEVGISSEMYDTLLGDAILNDLSQLESNDTMCSGNSQIIIEAVNFLYKPYPPTTDAMVLRKKFMEFANERKYVAPTVQLAALMSKHSETYVYRFDIKPRTNAITEQIPDWMGVPHKFDLIFFWGLPYWFMLADQTPWDSVDKRVAEIIMTLWVNFAKFTNPTQVGVYIKWDQFKPDNHGILIIDRSFNMSDSSTLNYRGVQFWNDYYPNVINFAAQCCNSTNYGNKLDLNFVCFISSVVVLLISCNLSRFLHLLNT